MLLFFLSFVLVVWERAGFSAPLERMAWWLLQPGQRVGTEWRYMVSELDAQRRFFLKGGALLAKLESDLSKMTLENDSLELLKRENALLRQELGDRTRQDTSFFALSGWREQWFIDGGCRDGVVQNAPVLFEGSLIGQIVEVKETSSQISTLLDSSWRVPVSIGTSSAQALLDTSRGMPEIREISRSIEEEEVVVTAGIGGLPRGIPVGRVGKVDRSFGKGVLESALLQPYFLPHDISFVETYVEKESTCEIN